MVLLVICATAIVIVAAPHASAAVIARGAPQQGYETLNYFGERGERNVLAMASVPNYTGTEMVVVFADAGAQIRSLEPGCVAAVHAAVCVLDNFLHPVAWLGDQDDIATVEGAGTLSGDGGDDSLTILGIQSQALLGQDAELRGGPGADTFRTSGEHGVVSYRDHHGAGVTVTMDGLANDGAPGEGDFVDPNIVVLYGSGGDDRIVGDSSDELLFGGAGSDQVSGGSGNDALFAGGPFGGPDGADILDGGAGEDTFLGTGNVIGGVVDRYLMRDGERDTGHCDGGGDIVIADPIDELSNPSVCGTIDRSSP